MEWRSHYCDPEAFDLFTARQFCIAINHGKLREYNNVIELGCDCLGFARFAITYLQEAKYTGVENSHQQVNAGIVHEISKDLLLSRKPRFIYSGTNYDEYCQSKFDFVFAFNWFGFYKTEWIRKQIKKIIDITHQSSKLIGFFPFQFTRRTEINEFDFIQLLEGTERFSNVKLIHECDGTFYIAQEKL